MGVIGEIIVYVIVDVLLLGLATLLLPLLTFGRVRVAPVDASGRFPFHGVRRGEDGRVEVGRSQVGLYTLLVLLILLALWLVRAHFFRQAKGRPQVAHVFSGRSPLRTIFAMMQPVPEPPTGRRRITMNGIGAGSETMAPWRAHSSSTAARAASDRRWRGDCGHAAMPCTSSPATATGWRRSPGRSARPSPWRMSSTGTPLPLPLRRPVPGSLGSLKPVARLTDAEFLRDYELNALGAVRAVQAALPALKAHEGPTSSILLVSTVAVAQGFAAHASVSMAKGAVEGLTVALAAELAPKIRVNCVAPSLTRTPLAKALTGSETMANAIAALHAIPRLGEPDDVAALGALLLDAEAGWITGQIIGVDGGRSMLRTKG
ncbi:MAG: short-chain dehydrogenase [Xanthobacteraceae bacterium]|nr:MAG: short-chain dehydrogenase [Xanthobacteraceae bacterium]